MSEVIIFATGNKGKMQEVRTILADLKREVLSMEEAGIVVSVEENGSTFAENAIIKAEAIAAQTKGIVLADDSGLVIDYLNGEPGIYSARYMGENTSYSEKNQKIIERLKDAKGDARCARFVCAIAAVFPDGEILTAEAEMEGRIGYEERGSNGFGYDPIFYLPEYDKTTAELSQDEKNKISHRGKALQKMKEQIRIRLQM